MALRIAAALAEAGVKVISGVPDGEQAASIQAFATKFELVRPASARNVSFKEVSLSDPDSGAAAIPRGSSVLFVLDDNIGASRVRTNVQAGVAVLDAAAAARAAEVILVTPIEPNGVPLGGRGNVGKLVAEAKSRGLPVRVIRVARPSAGGYRALASGEVRLGMPGSFPAQSTIPQEAAAEAVAVLLAAGADAGDVEIATVPGAEFRPWSELVSEAEAQWREVAGQEEPSAGAQSGTAKRPAVPALNPLSLFGSKPASGEKEEEAAEGPATTKVNAARQAAEERRAAQEAARAKKEAEAEQRRRAAEEARAAQEAARQKAAASADRSGRKAEEAPAFGMGALFGAGSPKAARKPEVQAEEPAPEPQAEAPAKGGLFGFAVPKPAAPKAEAPAAAPEKQPAAPARTAPPQRPTPAEPARRTVAGRSRREEMIAALMEEQRRMDERKRG